MTKRILTVIMAIGMAFAVLLCGSGCKEKNVNYYTLPDVAVGDTFEITLDVHGTGMYEWQYTISEKTGIEYVKRDFIFPNNDPNIIGGGTILYVFKAAKVGNYSIKCSAKIPWEPKTPPIENRVYRIKVVE